MDPRHPRQNFNPCHSRHPRENLMNPRYPCHPCHPCTHTTTLPKPPTNPHHPRHLANSLICHRLMSYVVCLHSNLRVLTSYYQDTKINYRGHIARNEGLQFTVFDKKLIQGNVQFHIQHGPLTEKNYDWTGKLQVILLSAERIVLADFQTLFGRSNRDSFWENEGQIHESGCVKELFS